MNAMRGARGVLLGLMAVVAGCGGGNGKGAGGMLPLEAPDDPMAPTHENIAMMAEQTCGLSSSCHAGTRGRADLNFDDALQDPNTSMRDLLVGVDSCQYPPQDSDGDGENDVGMPLVDPGNPANSWIWVKLNWSFQGNGKLVFEPDPAWDPSKTKLEGTPGNYEPSNSTCPKTEGGELSFGELMPQSSDEPLSNRMRWAWKQWIENGAPGPDGGGMMSDGGTAGDADTGSDAGMSSSDGG